MKKNIINYFKEPSPGKKEFLVATSLFLLAFVLRVIKAGFFVPWGDEWDAAGTNINNFEEATRWYRWHPMAPFHVAFNVVWKTLFNRSWFWERFPLILVGSLSVPLFYSILRRYLPRSRWPLILSFIPLTSFLLLYYAQDMRSYSYFWLLVLLTLGFGYRVVVEEETKGSLIFLLIFGFALLPLVHYISWPHFVALSGALAVSVLLFGKNKWRNIFKIFALDGLILVAYIPWADSAYYRFLRVFFIDPYGNPISQRPYRFDLKMFWNIVDKLAGGYPVWAKFLVILCLIGIILLALKTIGKGKFVALNPFDRFTWFIVFYGFFLLGMVFMGRFPEIVIPRHYFFLIWPFLFLLAYFLVRVWDIGQGSLRLSLRLFVIGIVSLFIINNSLNSTFYLLSPYRFSSNLKPVAEIVEPMLLTGQKKLVYSETGNFDTFKPYFRQPEKIDPHSIIPAYPYYFYLQNVDYSKVLKDLQGLIDCCRQETVFVFVTYSHERKPPPVNLKDLKLIKTLPGEQYLDYLDRIDASPYARGMEHEYPRGYSTYIIAY